MAKKAKKRGPKPLPREQKHGNAVLVKFLPGDRDTINAAAAAAGKPIATFLRETALERARSMGVEKKSSVKSLGK